jgi:hypothetical protein
MNIASRQSERYDQGHAGAALRQDLDKSAFGSRTQRLGTGNARHAKPFA